MLLARNGMAVLCYDPVGQGERCQALGPPGRQTVRYSPYTPHHPRVQFTPVDEHMLMGIGSILVGTNVARYRIFDGMRALDYLLSRPEIDPKRIGCTGISGGGTLTIYIAALDDRVCAAAPACSVCTLPHLVDHRGAPDAEQNIYGQLAFGMDEPDYLMMRAPRPTLICAGTEDIFPIEGVWDAFRQAKRFYARMNASECIELVEADCAHTWHPEMLRATARWFRRWLMGRDDAASPYLNPVLIPEDRLLCSPEGQVLLMPGERSVYDLNAQIEQELAAKRKAVWARTPGEELRNMIRKTAGVRPLADLSAPSVRQVGTISRANCRIEKLVLGPEPGISLPALLFVPPQIGPDRCLYLHGQSMKADAQAGGPIDQLVAKGQVVLAVELRGIGETETGHQRELRYSEHFGVDGKEVFLAYLLGKSFVGMRTEDALTSARYLAGYRAAPNKPRRVHLVGIGEAGVPALHAAALEPQLFASVRLRQTLASWGNLVRSVPAPDQGVHMVHGALKVCDLPELATLCDRDKLTIEDPVSGVE
jgi:dienelactone hydrolase